MNELHFRCKAQHHLLYRAFSIPCIVRVPTCTVVQDYFDSMKMSLKKSLEEGKWENKLLGLKKVLKR